MAFRRHLSASIRRGEEYNKSKEEYVINTISDQLDVLLKRRDRITYTLIVPLLLVFLGIFVAAFVIAYQILLNPAAEMSDEWYKVLLLFIGGDAPVFFLLKMVFNKYFKTDSNDGVKEYTQMAQDVLRDILLKSDK